jgi:eukaryotic-like serine/threonine-protein kinase
VRRGEAPKDNPERLALAQRAYAIKQYAPATRLWAEALASDAGLATDRQAQHLYNAACAAALAASTPGKDDPPPDDAVKARFRVQAMGWLKAELAAWSKLLESGPPAVKPVVAQTLRHWQEDPDLAGVRDAKVIEALPESERDGWRTLWKDVAATLVKSEKR